MKISEVIEKLQKISEVEGDIDVWILEDLESFGSYCTVSDVDTIGYDGDTFVLISA